MTSPPGRERSLDELMGSGYLSLDDLVDRTALEELAHSFFELFGIPIRVFGASGTLLADVGGVAALHTYLAEFPRAAREVSRGVEEVKAAVPDGHREVVRRCVTGAAYRVVPIRFDARTLGRWILGPYLPAGVKGVPKELLALVPLASQGPLPHLLGELPSATDETINLVTRHLRGALDLILFSGHKALLTSNLHLATVRESYRELERKNASLRDANERLQELDRLKSNFLATVSHELRTPLTSIIGYGEMLEEGLAGELEPEQREFVRTIREKGQQLLGLIQGLLDLAKLESGVLSVHRSDVDIAALFDDVVRTLEPAARRKEVSVEKAALPELPVLSADPDRLRQVLLNLAENALKFTPPGGVVTLEAGVSTATVPPASDRAGFVLLGGRRVTLELRVRDTGIGIPDAEKARVFDAFYQVDSGSTREQGGAGLGLSIVERLVRAHGGTVRVEDNQPRGALFVVSLPLA